MCIRDSSNEIGGVYQNTFKTSTDGGLTYNVKTLSPLIREGIYIESLQKAYIPVSYTHLDVYKRQGKILNRRCFSS